jgi:hypothetical protein
MDGKIGVFDRAGDDYHDCVHREIQEAAQAEGLAVEIFDSKASASQQAHDLVRFEHGNRGTRLCALVVPEADAMYDGEIESDPNLQVARRLLQKGVGWIVLNHGREEIIPHLRREFSALPVGMIVIDNVDFGRTQGQQLDRLLPNGGTALCVRGNPFDSACRDRSSGMRAELEGSRIVIEEIDARWDADTAEQAVYKWISSPIRRQIPLHAVVCQNDAMGVASRKALARAAGELGRPELTRLPVLGGDGLPHLGRRWVDEGALTATVCVTLPGKPAVAQLVRYWRNGSSFAALTRLPVQSYPSLDALSPAAQ